MPLSEPDFRHYFESRLGRELRGGMGGMVARCPFHDDRTASLSVNASKGVWKCHAGCGQGGLVDFEILYSKCDRETAWANINQLLGREQSNIFQQKAIATYQYLDAQGRLIFEKQRFAPKRFINRRRLPDGSWAYNLDGIALKPIYGLPRALVASELIVCEGEKDCDTVQAALGDKVACVTNFDGAGKWRAEDAVYFAGKRVVILPDNDLAGRNHAQRVAETACSYACGVKIVQLPGLQEKGDVSDFLATHSAQELIAEIKKAPLWRPAKSTLFVSAEEFLSTCPEEIDWLVEGVIERNANGFICAVPKGGKSWTAVDLAISLATGSRWLDFPVPQAVKVALIAREDNPALTAWRMKAINQGKLAVLEGRETLWVNTRQQSPQLLLDNAEQFAELLREMKLFQPQFAIFDVFNCLHSADENDSQEMRAVLSQLSRIQAEVGCGIGVVHHYNKQGDGSMTQRLRGSSAIAGWAEWLIGISLHEPTGKVRKMEFELKAAAPPEPIYYKIESEGAEAHLVRVNLLEEREQPSSKERYM